MGDYYLGLDMGTSTVGWAVTDEEYNLLRKKGKDLWGVREFEEANTAVERRTNRVSRRRRQRQIARIGLLKDYFHDEIAKVDPNFYVRLENSKYHLEDKDEEVRTPNGIFSDKEYSDADYFKDYPTIFHLRNELIKNSKKHDVRLVFLAILNIYKHRGHFLNPGVSSEETLKMEDAYRNLTELLEEKLCVCLPIIEADELEEKLGNRDLSRSKKAEEIKTLLGVDKKDKQKNAIIKALCGLKSDAKSIFCIDELDSKVEIEFSSLSFEDKIEEIQNVVGDELFEIVETMKTVYDIGMLAGILKGVDYLSESRISDYEKHRKDLRILKDVVKEYGTAKEYDRLFRSEDKGTYSAYVNSVSYDKLYKGNQHSKCRRDMKDRKKEDFYNGIKKLIKTYPQTDDSVKYILEEIEKDTFMPKQLTASNGIIPYQIHEKELKAILKNAKEYLPFLNEVDEESGKTVAERIVDIFGFQIPYYVGPLSDKSEKDGGNGWVVRKESGVVYPWNFEQKIDQKKTAEKFISRMVRKCTYMNGEQVLPKNSLIYESYCVLNEINNIKIDEKRLPVELKQDIYCELFQRKKKVSRTDLAHYFKERKIIEHNDQISGIDININSSLKSYHIFRNLWGEEIDTDAGKRKAEDIIFWCTVYGDSKKFLKENIKEKYPDISEAELKRITGFKFKDWGRFSKAFLGMEGLDHETGEVRSLIRTLWETEYNLMELINSDDFSFKEALNKMQYTKLTTLKELTHESLDDYYFSAPVKKMIWQTLGIIKEIIKIMGCEPKKVFIEMTRSDEEKGDAGRKNSRKKQLIELLKKVEDDTHDWKKLIEDSDESGTLRSKKMYLYITQLGKDIYTGKPINLNELFNSNLYDIDHIYPRHFVKDDSIYNNLVLARKEDNAHKSDTYPIEHSIRSNPNVTELWKVLRSKNLITEEKYRRLNRNSEFTDEEKAGFIARQLVETGQATKGVADIIKSIIPESDIVYCKARNVSDFRKKNNLFKVRSVNDFHHAQDAYLNIVVGNVYQVKFTKSPLNFIKNEYKKGENYHLSKVFEKDVARNGYTAWKAGGDKAEGTIATVKKVMKKNTPLITHQLIVRNGELFNQTIKSKKYAKTGNYIPLKMRDSKLLQISKYSGYTSIKPAYLFLVEHGKNGKRKREFASVPVILKNKLSTVEALEEYCVNKLGYENPRICVPKIKLHSLMKLDGYYVRITGLDSKGNIELHNAVSMCLNNEWTNYIKKIENTVNQERLKEEITAEKNLQLYDEITVKHTEAIFRLKPKTSGEMLVNCRERFIKLDLLEQCKTLVKILQLSRIGTTSVDMKIIEGAGEEGRMRITGNITKRKEALLLSQSITGVYEGKPINLLEV